MLSYKNNDVDRHRINTFQYSRFSINFPSLDNSSSQLTRERILKIFYSTIIELIQKKKKKKDTCTFRYIYHTHQKSISILRSSRSKI